MIVCSEIEASSLRLPDFLTFAYLRDLLWSFSNGHSALNHESNESSITPPPGRRCYLLRSVHDSTPGSSLSEDQLTWYWLRMILIGRVDSSPIHMEKISGFNLNSYFYCEQIPDKEILHVFNMEPKCNIHQNGLVTLTTSIRLSTTPSVQSILVFS